jgi:beta-lactamase superfamily II metal-dependent hydrolase
MNSERWRVLAFCVVAALAVVSGSTGYGLQAMQSGDPGADREGQPISPWLPGTLDIHQISTGQGNSALVVMPDGTTLLIDAGASTAAASEPRPNATRTPAAWIAYYIDRVLPALAPRRIDYALITHFHPDHMGQITAQMPVSRHGDYRLSGITEVAELMPVRRIIDRGWPDYAYPAPLTDDMVRNYRRFLDLRTADGSLVAERIRVGRADQFVPVINPTAFPTFEIRNVAANGEVWTGQGTVTNMRFPKFTTPDPDVSWENVSSIGIRIRYGRFGFYTGGDMYGIPDPGMPDWIDMETPVAQAIGPTDVHVVNMHGSISVENPFFLMTLRSRVIIVPSWAATHPSADVLKRAMTARAYPGSRDVFATVLRDPTRTSTGARADQLAGIGHIVVRVAAGGATYRVVVVDDSTDTLTVKGIKGPYTLQ